MERVITLKDRRQAGKLKVVLTRAGGLVERPLTLIQRNSTGRIAYNFRILSRLSPCIFNFKPNNLEYLRIFYRKKSPRRKSNRATAYPRCSFVASWPLNMERNSGGACNCCSQPIYGRTDAVMAASNISVVHATDFGSSLWKSRNVRRVEEAPGPITLPAMNIRLFSWPCLPAAKPSSRIT